MQFWICTFAILSASFFEVAICQSQIMPQRAQTSANKLSNVSMTFSLFAPQAKSVNLAGWDLMSFLDQTRSGSKPFEGMPMAKSDSGLWSITIQDLPPNTYQYHFNVDGLRVLDPSNIRIVVTSALPSSLFIIHSPQKDLYWEIQNVPHGTVEKITYYSSVTETFREMRVYLPPSYKKSNEKFPVLYLLHGRGERSHSWTEVGYANIIADNLIAAKKIAPCIIVMPDGHVSGQQTGALKAAGLFEKELLQHIVPYVDANYRTKSSKVGRAIAGLSMGGSQTAYVAFRNLNMFDYVGIFSSPIHTFEEDNKESLLQPDKLNNNLKLFFLGVGDRDMVGAGNDGKKGAFPALEYLHTLFEKNGVRHTFVVMPDTDHTWFAWRPLLAEHFLPMLWK